MLNRRLSFPIIVTIIVIALAAATAVRAQTTLVAGDIAFSGYLANAGAVSDQFSFVLLKAITSTTVIKFTDFGWRTVPLGFNSGAATESEITFTATSAMPAGTEIIIDGATATKAGGGSAGTIAYSSGGSFVSPLSLASTGDQILAYQGTFASPSFIAGMHMNVETAPASTAAAWDGTGAVLTGQTSEKPAALTTGVNANWFTVEVNNARFICGSTPIGTVAEVRSALNSGNVTPANWLKNSTNPPGFTLPTLCAYLAPPTAANAAISGRVLTANGSGIRNAVVTVTGGNLPEPLYATTGTFGYYNFDGLEVGQTYVVTVQSKKFVFANPDIILTLKDNVVDANFAANPD